MRLSIQALGVAILGALVLPMATSGQEMADVVELTSYSDLLDRIEQLENQVKQNSNVMHNASYNVGGGKADGCGCGTMVCGGKGACEPCGLYAMYENVIVKPHFSNDPAFSADDVDPDLFGANESLVEVPFDWEYGYSPRVEIGYMRPTGQLGWRARYWHFDHEVRADSANFDFIDGDVNAALFADDPDLAIESADRIISMHGVQLKVLDLETTKRSGDVIYSAGTRLADLEHNLLAFETDTDEVLRGDGDFHGIGPTVSIEVQHETPRGLTLFGSFRGSVLFGHSSYTASSADADDLSDIDDAVAITSDNDLIPVGEIQAGVQYNRYMSNGSIFFLRAATEGQYWLNGGVSFASVDDDADTMYTDPQEVDMGFSGFTISGGIIR